MLQFANKAGSLIMQHPFWVFVAGSVGIHTVFALAAPSPIKKAEPTEVVVSTVPVFKLPPKPLTTNAKSNIFDNLFSKSASKTGSLQKTFPDISSSPLTILETDSLSNFDGLPPVTDFSFSATPLPDDSNGTPQFVKPQISPSTASKNPSTPRFTPSGQIDNITPAKPPDNIKPEFRNSGLKGAIASNGDFKEKTINNILSPYSSNPKINDLSVKKLIKSTEIAPSDSLISNPEENREKGVTWIPPKRANTSGKSGSVTYMWLVNPSGKVENETEDRFLISSGIKELDDIVRETVKDYKFKPLEDPTSGKYRLVTVKYKFRY